MNKHSLRRTLFLCAVSLTIGPLEAGWDIKANLMRLSELSKTKNSPPADDALLKAVALIDRSVEGDKVAGEVRRLIDSKRFESSPHTPALIYLGMVNAYSSGRDLEGWFSAMRNYEGSVFFFPCQLVRLQFLKTKDENGFKRETEATVSWIKSVGDAAPLMGPEFRGTSVWGFKPRSDFREGALPPVHKKNEYIKSATPLSGFSDFNTYLALLEVNRDSDTTSEEMARIYLRMGDSKKAAANFFEIGNRRFKNRQFVDAKNFFQKAAALDGNNKDYTGALDKANLELLYVDSEEGNGAASSSGAGKKGDLSQVYAMGTVKGKNVNLRSAPSILGEPLDRVSSPLTAPILDTYVADSPSEGFIRGDMTATTEDNQTIELQNGKAVFIISDLGDEVIVSVPLADSSPTVHLLAANLSRIAGGKWYKIEANNRVGWIYGDFFKEK